MSGMIIIIFGNRYGDRSCYPEQSYMFHFHAIVHRKGMNPSVLLLTIGKQ